MPSYQRRADVSLGGKMKKLLIILIAVFLMAWSSVAHADYWRPVAPLVDGTYRIAWEYNAIADGAMITGLLFHVDNSSTFRPDVCKALNMDPVTPPSLDPVLSRKNKFGWWIQIDLPCKWTRGDMPI